jgi:hypothetical protein
MIIEFETIIDSEKINIPKYEALKNKKAKIIIIPEEEDFITKTIKNPYNIKDFLTREEANER